ncbi:MAG: LptF/LptG family permease [Opitutaceae bacterium]|nr:LptF/LptG family permease [Opitutaceae bacterium]
MSLLHRHILFSVAGSCAAAVGLFAFVLIVGNALKDLLQLVLSGQLPVETFVTLLALLGPFVAAYALPMGVLTGVLLVLGRMSAQHEITAMRAAGLSLAYIARPIFLLGAAAATLAAMVNYEYMPRARAAYKSTLAQAVQRNPLSFIVPKTFIRDFPGVVLYVGEKEGNVLRDVWMWELDKESRVKRSGRAETGTVTFEDGEARLVLTLRRVTTEVRKTDHLEDFSVAITPGTADEITLELQLDNLFGKQSLRKKLAWMTLSELRAEKDRLAEPPADSAAALKTWAVDRMRVSYALNEKGATALAVFAFAVLAVPLGIKVSRKETSANLGLALGLVMAYYFLTVCVGWLDGHPELRPDLLLWLPSLGFLFLAGLLFRRLGRV